MVYNVGALLCRRKKTVAATSMSYTPQPTRFCPHVYAGCASACRAGLGLVLRMSPFGHLAPNFLAFPSRRIPDHGLSSHQGPGAVPRTATHTEGQNDPETGKPNLKCMQILSAPPINVPGMLFEFIRAHVSVGQVCTGEVVAATGNGHNLARIGTSECLDIHWDEVGLCFRPLGGAPVHFIFSLRAPFFLSWNPTIVAFLHVWHPMSAIPHLLFFISAFLQCALLSSCACTTGVFGSHWYQ